MSCWLGVPIGNFIAIFEENSWNWEQSDNEKREKEILICFFKVSWWNDGFCRNQRIFSNSTLLQIQIRGGVPPGRKAITLEVECKVGHTVKSRI